MLFQSQGHAKQLFFTTIRTTTKTTTRRLIRRQQQTHHHHHHQIVLRQFASLYYKPSIIFSNNHLLVVNKPTGWHSIPDGSEVSSNNNNIERRSETLYSQQPKQKEHHRIQHNKRNKQIQKSKCLLSYLKTKQLGGGSRKDFLNPIHRIDQPCSGILVFGKNTKSTSRITKEWQSKRIIKTYIC